MVTVLRVRGLRFVIFVDDHKPAHRHVFGDGVLKINLLGSDGMPELVWADRMKRNDTRQATRMSSNAGRIFLTRWSDIHG
jgi:hypothetical protein